MSKLLQRLQFKPQPMGFRVAATAPKIPSLVLIAELAQVEETLAATAAERGADAILLSVKNLGQEVESLGRIAHRLGDTPWGIFMETLGQEDLAKLRDVGCDFLVFEGGKTPLAVLREEGIGKVIKVEPLLADSLARTIEQLPIDGALVGQGGQGPLTIDWAMACQRLTNLIHKPLIASVPLGLVQGDLESLREAGLSGLLVKVETIEQGDGIFDLRKAIDSLPLTRKPRERMLPLVPLLAPQTTPQLEEEEEEET